MSDYGAYHNPENYGLEIIGTIDWADTYEFDMICVWKRLEDGALLWAQDAGCSCPTPFEGFAVGDEIKPIEDLATFHAMLLAKNEAAMARKWGPSDDSAAITDLVTRLHGLGLR